LSSTAGRRQAVDRNSQVSRWQWLGLMLGLAGLTLVVWRKLGSGEVNPWNLLLAVGALLSITVGTLYQKWHVQACDVRSANAVQLLAALAASLPWAVMESSPVDLNVELIVAMAWSVLVLTVGGSSLLYVLIQQGVATRVTSLLYLVPPTTALLAWLIFGESFTLVMGLGMVLTVLGVALVVRVPAK
jgi:drug/metabolite transporter (DMT)-like permease